MYDIKFRLNLDKKEYLVEEPFVVYLDVKNVGTKPVSVIDHLDPKFYFVKFYVRRESLETLFVSYMHLDLVSPKHLLKPNESLREGVKIFYGARDWTFNSAGKYQIRATFNGLQDDRKEKIKSNSFEVEIMAPRTEQEKEQVDLIMGDEQGLFLLFEGGDHLLNGVRKLTKLVNKYPGTALSGYANFALGMSYSRDFRDFSKGKVRPADTKKSISFLENAKKMNLNRYYTTKVYTTLARIFESLNDKRAILKEFIERFSRDSDYKDSLNEVKNMLRSIK